jgi:hypothetical protein
MMVLLEIVVSAFTVTKRNTRSPVPVVYHKIKTAQPKLLFFKNDQCVKIKKIHPTPEWGLGGNGIIINYSTRPIISLRMFAPVH